MRHAMPIRRTGRAADLPTPLAQLHPAIPRAECPQPSRTTAPDQRNQPAASISTAGQLQ